MNKMSRLGASALSAGLWSLFAHKSWAQEVEAVATAAAAAPAFNAADTVWVMLSSVLVLLMIIPGLALFYGGMVRKKNVLAIMMQCFFLTAFIGLLWVLVGYSLAFAPGNPFVGGLSKAFFNGIGRDSLTGSIPESLFAIYQMMFAAITPAVIVGAFADRMKFSAMLWSMGLWLIVVYCPVTHMVWASDGWLFGPNNPSGNGVLDLAGGLVVEINSGVTGLVAALIIGQRKGLGSESMAPHNLVLTVIGASLLWVGWFGFNAGSVLAVNERTAYTFLNTHMAACAAVVSWVAAEWWLRGKPSILGAASGAVAGLVGITPACGFVGLGGAIIIGLVAGVVGLWAVSWLKAKLQYDDALDCFGIHGVCGIVGTIGTGIFALQAVGGTSGLLEGNSAQFFTQIFAVVFTIVFVAIGSFLVFKLVDLLIGLRVSDEVERDGLDFALHGETIHD